MTLILRFRDLNIPLGETIGRHRRAIQENGYVWWGWIRRQKETFPADMFASLAASCRTGAALPVYLFDSGAEELHLASLSGISAAPGGLPLPTPETRCTPTYMAEAVLSAWFKLTAIEAQALERPTVSVKRFPTLPAPGKPDLDLLAESLDDLSRLRHSGATLWEAAVENR